MYINARCMGWTIRDYALGDIYADIYCPHGFAIDTINAIALYHFDLAAELDRWVLDTRMWHDEYCYGH